MSTTLSDIRTALNRRLASLSKYISNEILGTGDGSKTIFYVKLPPISSSSLTVYVDDTVTTSYAVDEDYGRITFTSAVANGSVPSADYKGMVFHSQDLDDVITEAVEQLYVKYRETAFSISGSAVSPDPTAVEKRFIIQQCVVNLLDNLLLSLTMDAIRTAQTGFSFDSTARAETMRRIRDKYAEELDREIEKENISLSYSNDPDLIY